MSKRTTWLANAKKVSERFSNGGWRDDALSEWTARYDAIAALDVSDIGAAVDAALDEHNGWAAALLRWARRYQTDVTQGNVWTSTTAAACAYMVYDLRTLPHRRRVETRAD